MPRSAKERMDFDLRVKVATYGITAERGMPPSLHDVARATGSAPDDVRDAFARLMQKKLLVLEPDGATIRMAPPFSGVPTQHRVQAGGVAYYANCAWDALGIPAALGKDQLWRLSVTWYATRLQPDS